MKVRRTLAWAINAMWILGGVMFYLWLRPGNGDLKKHRIPTIPGSFKVLHTNHGGLFSAWFFMVADLKESNYQSYRDLVERDADEALTIGKDVRLIKYENYRVEDEAETTQTTSIEFLPVINDQYFEWWDTDKIKRGMFYKKSLPDACGYRIAFDDQRKRVFIYWYYS